MNKVSEKQTYRINKISGTSMKKQWIETVRGQYTVYNSTKISSAHKPTLSVSGYAMGSAFTPNPKVTSATYSISSNKATVTFDLSYEMRVNIDSSVPVWGGKTKSLGNFRTKLSGNVLN